MIVSEPIDWKDLQNKVAFILNCVGIVSEKEKTVHTPRGKVELDIYGIDKNSIDKIKYIIECKNWNKKVPQNVVHSFTQLMIETGSNIGYIISKKGFQKGAFDYINSTNIRLFTFKEFELHYFDLWYKNYFVFEIFKHKDDLLQFTELYNNRRFKFEKELDEQNKIKNKLLIEKYFLFASITYSRIFTLQELQDFILKTLEIKYSFDNYMEALETFLNIIEEAKNEFYKVYGKNIFIE